MMDRLHIHPGTVAGSVRIPSSKSLCHRAIICAALADGKSVIRNITLSEDITATIEAMEQLGAKTHWEGEALVVQGIRGNQVRDKRVDIFCNESGSGLRFLIPIAAAMGAKTRFTGAGRLPERPLTSYYEIMETRGWAYHREGPEHLPLVIEDPWESGVFRVAGNISSQFITGLLLALPLLEGDSVIEVTTELESRPYVDLTLDVMAQFGITVVNDNYQRFTIPGSQKYRAQEYTAEGDFSQAAFFLVAAAVASTDQGLLLEGLRADSHQGDKAILEILEHMGAALEWTLEGNLRIRRAATLQGIVVDASQCPDLVPIVAVLGALSEGTMQITHAQRLRIKECDRLQAVAAELSASGVTIQETQDGLIIEGIGTQDVYPGGKADSWNDHRIAMASGVLALRTEKGIDLTGAGSVRKSWPSFWRDFEHIGGVIHEW